MGAIQLNYTWYVICPQNGTAVLKVGLGGESVMKLRLDRRSVNLLPVAQRNIDQILTNGIIVRTWVGRDFESHVHDEKRLLKRK